ncbi:cytochrome c oxidase assembly factor 5-like [Clavelina lepadiformis]|uniref:cytochrome c oxidase assembly factor 5-like n=1 Tax=Clavelina lepadiformis TaxID=159417 RepID=UPI004041ED32
MSSFQLESEPDDVPIDTNRACWRLRHDLKKCMYESDCIQKDKRPIRECFLDPAANVPEACRNLQYTYQQCRRSMLDMRTRFRGRKGDNG